MIIAKPLTVEAFAPYGDVIEAINDPSFMINAGKCGRFHDLANTDFEGGKAGISLAHSAPYALPLSLTMIERHPLGSQMFMPLDNAPFLVVVSDGPTATPKVFITNGAQGINYFRGTWHGVLTPLNAPQNFLIVDRIGTGSNLEEHFFDTAFLVDLPNG
ncbi:MAG: ureidoglycolate lyase [Rhodobacteraceae bacterium]|nr:ureidoglycolate lyase [Paracoccaceae bacterium]